MAVLLMHVYCNNCYEIHCSLKVAMLMSLDLKGTFLEVCDIVKGKMSTSMSITRLFSDATNGNSITQYNVKM